MGASVRVLLRALMRPCVEGAVACAHASMR